MIKKMWRFKVQFFILLLSIVVSWYCASLIKNYPETGISVKYNSDQYVICDLSKYSWAGKRDFQIGDIIEQIDGEPPSKHFTVSSYHSIEQVKKITLNRNGEIKEFEIEYPPYSKQVFYHLIIPIGFYIVCLLMVLYLLIFVPEINRSTNDLLYFLISLGVSFISIIAAQRKDTLSFIVASISLVCVFTFFIRFMKMYFSNNQIKFLTPKQLKTLNFISIFLVILSILIHIKYNEWANLFTITLSALLFLFTVYLLVRFYFKSGNSSYFKYLKIIIISFLVSAIPFICLYLIPNLFYGEEFISSETTGIFFLFIPICIFYLVISGKMFNFKFIIQRLPYYIVLSVGVNMFCAVLGMVIFEDSDDHLLKWVKFRIISIIICICFLYIKDYIDLKLRKSLYHHQKNYQFSLHRFLHQAKNEYKLSNLIYSIRREISDILKIEETCCVEINKREHSIHVLESEYIPRRTIEALFNHQLDTYQVGSIIQLDNHFGCVLSISGEKMIILVCNHSEKENLNIDEMVWIETLCNYTDLLLECSNQIEDLIKQLQEVNDFEQPPMWLARLMFKLSEKERTNLASDIHDGVLQDQIRLSRKFESYKARVQDEETKKILNEIEDELLDHIYTIRETCNNLRPPFLYELGLKQALINLFKQINLKATFFFYYDIPERIVAPSVEHEQAIYRIMQELLNNAMKHSKATNVTVRLFEKDEHLYLTYIDNGVGIELDEVNYSYNTLGLSGIVTRIQSLNGEMTVESKPNRGLQIIIKF
ncbi:ATP-binding protein [Bacillus cereus group sp. MYBK35-2]|uniref:ATP-binding protein n=1 Tax=unclassified Bacillus cereus group TaxID=2750818 RepID=UPI0029F29C47|nr:ATP-binding protein [Bacillus cereus]MDA2318861.1 ATP-binding protein [Bacillus cereus]MDA2502004.1 ATP-binding protein [Bacillus cereus]